MKRLEKAHNNYLKDLNTSSNRYLYNDLPWNERLVGVKGFRGVGKTTLFLQYIKQTYGYSEDALYVSLDSIYFSDNRLIDLVDDFVAKGGTHLFLDEVHKYPNWSIELKNIYDEYRNLKITFTASSLLEILNSTADLSRRALMYELKGLSFREFLNFTLKTDLPQFNLEDILNNHISIAAEITEKIKPLKHFQNYLEFGYYPFFLENKNSYYRRLEAIVNMVIDIELPLLRDVMISKIIKIKQLLYIIAQSVPFKPNISKLSAKTGINRNTLVEYIKIMADANILNIIYKNSHGISLLQKPEKLYLENTNLAYMLTQDTSNQGNIRETFFLNQISQNHKVSYPEKGDFFVNEKYLFEIGGKNKTSKQISGIANSFIAAEGIEMGRGNTIPLWLFGFLY